MSTLRERYEVQLRQSVERYFREFCEEHRLELVAFEFKPEFGGWLAKAKVGTRAFQMWDDRGEIWVKSDVTSEVWGYPARDHGELFFTGECKKVRYLLGLVQSDVFLSATIKPPAPFYQKYVNDGPVI